MGASIQNGGTRQRGGKRRPRAPMSEINVTPFVDVMLVLLIIFMVTARMITAGVPVELPGAGAQSLEDPNKKDPLTVTVSQEGKIFLQESEISLEEIAAKLAAIAQNNFDQAVFVRGDKRTNYGTLMTVMSKISKSGFKRISLVTDPDEHS